MHKIIKQSLLALMILLTLTHCTSTDVAKVQQAINSNDPKSEIAKIVRDKGRIYRQNPDVLMQDIKQLPQLLNNLEVIVRKVWGDKWQLPSRNKYVKYTNGYQSRAEVDFTKGVVRVETIATNKPLEQLKKAIVVTLLTTQDPSQTDIFSDKTPVLSGQPYLLGEVLDQDNKPIAYSWRANRFADFVIARQLQRGKVGRKNSYFVEIDMVGNHDQLRQQKYAKFVLAAANKYKVAPDLIYAIIETESSFNPFAVSSANAYGLMQVIPATAGKDVYDKVMNKPGMPSRSVLFNVEDNIHIGTAYLHLLQTRYLAKVNAGLSRHYSVISAYNGGAGNVANTFSRDRNRAWQLINQLTSAQVYRKLTTDHPKAESRRYLEKVIKAQKRY